MQKQKKPIELKAIQTAINERFPLYWERHGKDFELHAITYTWENGSIRTRLLWRISAHTPEDLAQVGELHKDLTERKANVSRQDSQSEISSLVKAFHRAYDYKEDAGMYVPHGHH